MTNTERVCDFLKKCNTYYLGTADGDQPRVRPFGTINVFDGKLYIQTGRAKDVAQQIFANPKVEIAAFDGEKWLRVCGKLAEDPSVEAKKDMLDNYPDLRAMYDENDENTVVFYFVEGQATFSSFTESPETMVL